MGKPLLIETYRRMVRLTTEAWADDIGNSRAIWGIVQEFYENIKKYYDDPNNWNWEKRSEYMDSGQTRQREGEGYHVDLEPSAALKVLRPWMDKGGNKIVYMKVDRESGVKK